MFYGIKFFTHKTESLLIEIDSFHTVMSHVISWNVLFHMWISTLSHGICFFHTWSQISICEDELTPHVRWTFSQVTGFVQIMTFPQLNTQYSHLHFQKVQMRSAFLGEMGIKISKRGNKTWVSSMFSHILTCWLAIWTNVLTCKNRWTSHVNIYTTNGHFWQTNSTFPNLNYICSLVIKCISSACDWHLNMWKCNDMWTEHVFWSVFAYEWQFSHQKVHIFGYE